MYTLLQILRTRRLEDLFQIHVVEAKCLLACKHLDILRTALCLHAIG
jgi:hypothetical protein